MVFFFLNKVLGEFTNSCLFAPAGPLDVSTDVNEAGQSSDTEQCPL